jgi:hypothetical protein
VYQTPFLLLLLLLTIRYPQALGSPAPAPVLA